MSDDIYDRWPTLAAILLFALIAVLIAIDLAADHSEGASLGHVAIELFILAIAAGGAVVLWRQLRQVRSDLAEARVEAERWRQENRALIEGLGVAIEGQFLRWGLTKAEQEIGLLLLKGLSHKEISAARQTSERTIREQARSLYRKSGLSGRASLAAFFLEDLLLPPAQAGGEPAARPGDD